MKRVRKSSEPKTLEKYRQNIPGAKWESMRNDAEHGGDTAYSACRETAAQDQGHICAYCECKIQYRDPLSCRVEHFHDKSDTSSAHNWSLEWTTMLAVCLGGEREGQKHHLPENLSCDSHKNHMTNAGQYSESEGWILNPLQMDASRSLFDFDKATGCLIPHKEACGSVIIEGNKHATTQELVQHTIDILNLNCDRLKEERRKVLFHLENLKKAQRTAHIPPQQALPSIARQLFQVRWPAYFTTIRCLLGQYAEEYLQSIVYQG